MALPVGRLAFVSLVSLSLSLGACKGKPETHGTAGSGSSGVVAASGSDGSGTSMGALVPNTGKAAPDIVLPHGDGTPPPKSPALTATKLQSLSTMQFPGFTHKVSGNDASSVEITQTTDSRPRLEATITVGACGSDCTPIELDKWKPQADALKKLVLSDELIAAPGTEFELGEADLHGTKLISERALGYATKKDEDGNTTGSYSYSYTLYYNDGTNEIKVVAAYRDDMTKTKDAMTKLVPLTDLQKIATAFVDIYTHSW